MSTLPLPRSCQSRLMAAFFACLLVFPTLLIAADEKPAPKEDDAITAVKRQTLKGFTFYYKTAETNVAGIRETVQKIVPELDKALAEGKAAQRGGLIFIYHGLSPDPNTKFTIEIGVPVAEGAKPVGDFKVREVPEYHCASVLYSGPLMGLGAAFEKLFTEAMPKVTDEAREMYLYFETPESPNNVVHVSLGTKE